MKDLTVQTQNLLDAGIEPQKVLKALAPKGSTAEVLCAINGTIEKYESAGGRNGKRARDAFDLMKQELEAQFIIYRDEKDTAVVFKRINGANTISESSVEGLNHCAAKTLWDAEHQLGNRKIAELVDTWLLIADCTRTFPKSFSVDASEVAFNHIEICIEDGETLVFDDFIKRCGNNGPALMAYIWSIFEEKDNVQQYVIVKGEGRDGKGSIMRLIERMVGSQAYQGMSAKDSHWVAKLVGKRVAYWGDVNSTTFVLSSDFKSLIGGDKVVVTEKYKASYSAYLAAKIFISTNNDPEITSRKSDLRRCIYVEVQENLQSIEDYEEKLWSERAGILFKCKAAYQQLLNKKEKIIACASDRLIEKTEDFEVKFSGILLALFELSPAKTLSRGALYNICKAEFKFTQEYAQFKNWLIRNHGIREVSEVIPGSKKAQIHYSGIKQRGGP